MMAVFQRYPLPLFALGFLGTSVVTGTWGRGDWVLVAVTAFWVALRVQQERLDQ